MSERKLNVPRGLTASPTFSPGVQVGQLLYISGQVAQDNRGDVVGVGDCTVQTAQMLSRIRTIAEAAGASMQDVVEITAFLTNVDDYPAYNKVRSDTFPHNPPASSTVIVAALVRPEYLVEVEAVVHVRS